MESAPKDTPQNTDGSVGSAPERKTQNARGTAALLAMGVAIIAASWLALKDSRHANPPRIEGQAPPRVAAQTPADTPALSVIGYDWARNTNGTLALVGTVKNSSSKKYAFVQVEFNLYDNAGTQIGSASSNGNNLEPGGTWTFEAVVHREENVADAKLKGVTGF